MTKLLTLKQVKDSILMNPMLFMDSIIMNKPTGDLLKED